MKQFLSYVVQPPNWTAVTSVPAKAISNSIFAPAWKASSIEREPEDGWAQNQSRFGHRRPLVAPSLRLRATKGNRSLLRWMRAAELVAWERADASALRALNHFQH